MKKLMIVSILITQLFSQYCLAETWQNDVTNWRTDRVANLTKPFGWLSLIGMEWLHKGKNSVGSAADNSIVLPHGPDYIGSFMLNQDGIVFVPNKGIEITANDTIINSSVPVMMDTSDEATIFKVDTFLFYVIERGKPALRIKDSSAQGINDFSGIDYFPLSEEYVVEATFIPYEPVKVMEIINVLGLLSKETALGQLSFDIKGENYKLDVMDSDDDYYVIFADKTSGRTTYGPGRFIYVPKPIANNLTTINFHKAYNPPCAFSDYSTCPLPPPQNRISVYIDAGEKKYKR